jgi:hypothetical protein
MSSWSTISGRKTKVKEQNSPIYETCTVSKDFGIKIVEIR